MAHIDYFYSAHSAFAYFGSARLQAIADGAGRSLLHRPFDLRKTVAAVSGTANGARSEAHRHYFFGREVERWSQVRKAPIARLKPTHHDNDPGLANCLLIAAQQAGRNIDGLAHGLLEAHWRDDADLADPQTLTRIADIHGMAALLDAARSDRAVAAYDANTREAIDRSVFGSPTYFVDSDMFYGQDRLELVALALQQPA